MNDETNTPSPVKNEGWENHWKNRFIESYSSLAFVDEDSAGGYRIIPAFPCIEEIEAAAEQRGRDAAVNFIEKCAEPVTENLYYVTKSLLEAARATTNSSN